MAKQRFVKTSFRSDQYVETLSPLTKLLFLYLLTNECANLIWIYELSIKRMVFETGIELDDLKTSLKTLEQDWKVYYLDNRVVFRSYIKHQSCTPSIVQGMIRERDLLPSFINERIQSIPTLGGLRSTLLNLTLLNLTLPIGSSSDFEKFRNLYPRKEAKWNAEKSFKTATTQAELQTILDWLANYVTRIKKEKIEKQFIKLPATWLNQKCWLDQPTSPTPPPKREQPTQEVVVMTDEQRLAARKKLAETRSSLTSKFRV